MVGATSFGATSQWANRSRLFQTLSDGGVDTAVTSPQRLVLSERRSRSSARAVDRGRRPAVHRDTEAVAVSVRHARSSQTPGIPTGARPAFPRRHEGARDRRRGPSPQEFSQLRFPGHDGRGDRRRQTGGRIRAATSRASRPAAGNDAAVRFPPIPHAPPPTPRRRRCRVVLLLVRRRRPVWV